MKNAKENEINIREKTMPPLIEPKSEQIVEPPSEFNFNWKSLTSQFSRREVIFLKYLYFPFIFLLIVIFSILYEADIKKRSIFIQLKEKTGLAYALNRLNEYMDSVLPTEAEIAESRRKNIEKFQKASEKIKNERKLEDETKQQEKN